MFDMTTTSNSEFELVLPTVFGAEDLAADPAASAVEPAGDAAAAPSTEPIPAEPVVEPDASIIDPNAEPAEPAVPDTLADFDKLFPADEAEPVVDPNAPAPVTSEAMTKAFAVSEYVKDESQVENAIRAADEVFQVQQGKIPAHQMLEGFRARDPQGFEKIVRESLIPYIEHLTGQKLGGAAAAAPDPLATMQAEIERLKGQPQRDEEQRQATASRNNADTVTRTHVDGLIKAGTGIFDGDTNGAIMAMAAQLPKLGLTVDKLMADVNAGRTGDLDRAYKAAEKAAMAQVKAQGTRLIARSRTLRAALPPGKGNPATAAVAGELAPDATRDQMIAYLKG